MTCIVRSVTSERLLECSRDHPVYLELMVCGRDHIPDFIHDRNPDLHFYGRASAENREVWDSRPSPSDKGVEKLFRGLLGFRAGGVVVRAGCWIWGSISPRMGDGTM